MDAHMEKQPPIKGHAWSPRVWEPGVVVAQHGIPVSGMALVPALPWSVAWPMSSHGATTSKAAADADIGIGMACAAPVKAGIW
jgi:hypothetical protein